MMRACVVLLFACSSQIEGTDDGVVTDMSCPSYNLSSGQTNPTSCSQPPTQVCRYFEAYCLCLSGEWNCCGNGGGIPCPFSEPATGDPCCQAEPLYSPAGPVCHFGCSGGLTTTCVCGDDLRWQCVPRPLPDGGVPGCNPDAGI
jgi:hypothetical protein